jgi:hypothetical protein
MRIVIGIVIFLFSLLVGYIICSARDTKWANEKMTFGRLLIIFFVGIVTLFIWGFLARGCDFGDDESSFPINF